MTSTDRHQRGKELFGQGRYAEAALQFEESLQLEENSEAWNDWAAAKAAAGCLGDAKRGFEMALHLNPQNLTASENLLCLLSQNTPGNHACALAELAKALHEEAIRRHNQGKNGDALLFIKRALRSEETGLRWNDFAVIQLALQNPAAAEAGFRRALELDQGNRLAAANLVVLLETLGRDGEAAQFIPLAPPELVNPRSLARRLFKYLLGLPSQNPELSASMIQALDRSRNSGFLVLQCRGFLDRLPSENESTIVAALELLAAERPAFHSVLGLWHMDRGNHSAALAAFHRAFDSNPADLFAESMIVECAHLRHTMDPAYRDPFEGMEEYLRESFCPAPWEHLEFGADDGAYLCCPAWLPMCVGVPSTSSVDDIWRSEVAAEIRNAVLDGSFKYCSKIHCPRIAGRDLPSRVSAREQFPELHAVFDAEAPRLKTPAAAAPPKPSTLVLSYDRTCNLACPQCRSSHYSADRVKQEQMERDYEPRILTVLQHATNLTLNGAGEVFGSKHSRRILGLLTREQYPHLKFSIISNGQLFDRKAFETFDLHGRLRQVEISIDAARPETYKVVRRGGDFERLMRNLRFLDDLRIGGREEFHLELRFVASALNFREIPEFITLAKGFHADLVRFTIIRNFETYSKTEFERINVGSPTNPLHGEFVNILSAPELLDPIVDMGSLQTYRMNAA